MVLPAEGFKCHVATDGSLQGETGKWGACGWAVVQLDYDEEMEPLHGMYGSVEAELEVQRTVKRCECFAVFSSTRGVYSLKDVQQSRYGLSRPSCQGPSGVVCCCALCCRMH